MKASLAVVLASVCASTSYAQRTATAPHPPPPRATGIAPRYELFVLPPLPGMGGAASDALSVNDQGQVAGSSGGRPFVWSVSTGTVDLGPDPTAATSEVWGIDAFGNVAGESAGAVVWTAVDVRVPIPVLAGAHSCTARALNDQGVVVGSALLSNSPPYPTTGFVWDALNGTRDLETLGATGVTFARDVNEANQVAGSRWHWPGRRPCRFDLDTGTMHSIGTLGGEYGEAYGINDLGHVVGWAHAFSYFPLPFLWTPEDGIQSLGWIGPPWTPQGGAASAVNSADAVVGSTTLPSGEGVAFLWDPVDGMRDLNTLVHNPNAFVLTGAHDISDSGWIVGVGVERGGLAHRAFALRPRSY